METHDNDLKNVLNKDGIDEPLLVSRVSGGNFLHNHIKLLEEAGFEVVTSEILNDLRRSRVHNDLSKQN